jgi:two-component system sensor histidine kinase TtrS
MGWIFGLLGAIIAVSLLCAAPWAARAQEKSARIGVLAYRGTAAALTRWQPLADYLSDRIRGWRFKLVPVTLVSATEQLQTNELEFLITNPGHFVTLAERFSLSALATRERRDAGQKTGLMHFGTVIFARAGREDIQTLADVDGKTLAAVSPEAFGGFQMAWYEFTQQGIDPFKDFKAIRYKGFPQDEIVMDVASGRADVGVVRTGLLESLTREGRIKIEDFKVLFSNAQTGFPYLVSSRLHPEWPFAAREGTDKRLLEAVALALLQTQDTETARRYALRDLWSAPLSYEDVRDVISTYQSRNAAAGGEPESINQFWFLIALGVLALALGLTIGLVQLGRIGGTRSALPGRPAPRDAAQDDRRKRFETLTPREREILSLICRGEPTKRIAETLHISPKTVEYHRANLLHKTKAHSTPRMVQLATRFGFDQVHSLGETP